MAEELGPIEIVCDAPSYAVVRACAGLGFHAPQDVRWQRLDRHAVKYRSPGFFSWRRPDPPRCLCGQAIPALQNYTFTFLSGARTRYFLTQCGRCWTLFWDKE